MAFTRVVEKRAEYAVPGLTPSRTFLSATIGDGQCNVPLTSYNRRDFYKISFIATGRSKLLYANRDIEVVGPALIFTNPLIPYAWEGEAAGQTGFFCAFKEEFLQESGRLESLQESTLFKVGGDPVYLLDDVQAAYVGSIFKRMREEDESGYVYKHEILRSQLNLIIHEAIKMQPAVAFFTPPNAAARITNLFLTLLEKQFPVDSLQYVLWLKKAGDYAEKLSVHVNHLNAAVQDVTGKSTSSHINERIIAEASSLLTHTDWSVAEIASCLGFEYASYFNNFFKKHVGVTPLAVRKKTV